MKLIKYSNDSKNVWYLLGCKSIDESLHKHLQRFNRPSLPSHLVWNTSHLFSQSSHGVYKHDASAGRLPSLLSDNTKTQTLILSYI